MGCVFDMFLGSQELPFELSHPAILAMEFDGLAASEELLHLFLSEHFCVLHLYLHSAAERPRSLHFQDHLVLELSPVSGSSSIG